jgi:uncharacterized protein YjeT (DUF2065 family)
VQLDWSDLLAAVGLLLVLEGLFPFLNPDGTRRLFARLALLAGKELRVAGLISMLLGMLVLFYVRSSN